MKSLHKVLDIIDAVAEAGSLGIGEISDQLGFPPSTIHRIVSTLVVRGYFKQDAENRRYSLSVKFLELASMVQLHINLTSIARPHLERLMAETRESANIAVQDGDEVVYLDVVQSNHSMLQLFTKVGARVPLYCTGVGKLFLSQMAETEINAYLKRTPRTRFTSNTFVKEGAILAELSHVKARGYAVDNEEMENGVRCIASLVFDHNGKPIAAVSISGAAMRIVPDRIEQLGQSVKDCTRKISQALGFQESKVA